MDIDMDMEGIPPSSNHGEEVFDLDEEIDPGEADDGTEPMATEDVGDDFVSLCLAETPHNGNIMEEEIIAYNRQRAQERVSTADFELLKLLGRGSFGKVLQVRKITGADKGTIYAMKIVKKARVIRKKEDVEHTRTERNILQDVKHPFIVSLQYAFQTDGKLYLVMDYLNGGELFYHLNKEKMFSEELARFYAAEIVTALEHLHKLGIIYRDLKPENILLDEQGHLRLTDFGLSKESVFESDAAKTFCGTAEYMAPEVLQRCGHGPAVDWWSLGTLIYEMLTGWPPFYSNNRKTTYDKILRGKLQIPSHLTEETKSILRALLKRSTAQRLGSGPGDAQEVKAHPFFRGIDWDKVTRMELKPPFVPVVKDGFQDATNFDPKFLKETPTDSPVDTRFLSQSVDNLFSGFTYVAPSILENFGPARASPPSSLRRFGGH